MFAPTPFAGSDGDNHLVYEISLTNYMRTPVTVAGVEVLDATTDREVSGAHNETASTNTLSNQFLCQFLCQCSCLLVMSLPRLTNCSSFVVYE